MVLLPRASQAQLYLPVGCLPSRQGETTTASRLPLCCGPARVGPEVLLKPAREALHKPFFVLCTQVAPARPSTSMNPICVSSRAQLRAQALQPALEVPSLALPLTVCDLW